MLRAGCAFVSYCGPFNQEFRDYIVTKKLTADLKKKDVPCSPSLDVISLLVDVSETSDWALAGLPGDPLSIQNGIVVTRSSRYPLLIDPQGQAIKWIRQHEAERLPNFGVTALNNPRIKDQLEFAMAEGKALVVSGVEEALDPMLDAVLNKQWIQKGKSKYINLMDKLCEFQETFALYLITRLPNPHFSPEDQAKCVVVDFTVTQCGSFNGPPYAIDATRLHLLMKWVVPFSISSLWKTSGPSRRVRATAFMKMASSRPHRRDGRRCEAAPPRRRLHDRQRVNSLATASVRRRSRKRASRNNY